MGLCEGGCRAVDGELVLVQQQIKEKEAGRGVSKKFGAGVKRTAGQTLAETDKSVGVTC